MTIDEKIRQAAENSSELVTECSCEEYPEADCWFHLSSEQQYIQTFERGANWMLSEVQLLIEALEYYSDDKSGAYDCHIAREAIAAFRGEK